MSRYKAYPEYMDSGLQWLGAIPDHWEVIQSRRLFSQRKERAQPSDEQLTASQKYGVIYQKLFMELEGQSVVQVQTGSDILKHVEANDFVISMRSFQGGLEWCQYPGSVSSAYVGIIPVKHVVPEFFRYLFKSESYVQALQSTSNLVRDGQALRFENFSQVHLPQIPEDEQKEIAAFLDHETARIDALIEKQQRLIELLKEKRQTVISHAVTKGLDPNAPMKDSGVEWLGEVPAHWAVRKFGYISMVVRGGSPRPAGDPALFNGDYSPWVTVAEITKDDEVYLNETETYLTKKGSDQCRVFSKGTLLLSNSGATLGVPKILNINANANDGVVGFENLTLNHEFAYFYLSTLTDDLRERIKQGSGQPNLNTDIVKDISVPVPPDDEVEIIVDSIKITRERFNSLMEKAAKGIELLQERRTALISSAVTGKIDVRDWQAAA